MIKKQRTKKGVVLRKSGTNTVLVEVTDIVRHAKYQKRYAIVKRFSAHTTNNDIMPGQKVVIEETRPRSKSKRWRVLVENSLKQNK